MLQVLVVMGLYLESARQSCRAAEPTLREKNNTVSMHVVFDKEEEEDFSCQVMRTSVCAEENGCHGVWSQREGRLHD